MGAGIRRSVDAVRSFGHATYRRFRRLTDPPLTFAPRIPESILIAPPDILEGDTEKATAIYGGRFELNGHTVDTNGYSPFLIEAPDSWKRALHGFGWLRHCREAGTELASANARALTGDWFQTHGRPSANVAWEPKVVASRFRYWLSHSPVLLGHGDFVFFDKYLRQLALHHRFLKRAARDETEPLTRIHVLTALSIASLAFPSSRQEQVRHAGALGAELNRQTFPDGGHISRRADVLVDLLSELLPLRQCYLAKGMVAPRTLLVAIDRMLPALRMQCHADGTLAAHCGTVPARTLELRGILSLEADGIAQTEARDSGFERLVMGGTVVVADTGASPSAPFDRTAHDGSLSFELSSGIDDAGRRFVINLGPAMSHEALPDEPSAQVELTEAMRSRAAHSTLELNIGAKSERDVRRIRRDYSTRDTTGTREAARVDAEDGSFRGFRAVRGTHAKGVIHERILTVTNGGDVLRGSDRLRSEKEKTAASFPSSTIRFHIHPDVSVRQRDDGIELRADTGEVWHFATAQRDAVSIAVEPSLYCAGTIPRPTKQIVVGLDGANAVEWSFTRAGRSAL